MANDSAATPAADTPQAIASRWLGEIDAAERHKVKEWHQRGDRIVRRFKDEREDRENLNPTTRKMNLLWSNVQTIEPALYAMTPKPDVQRRYNDRDPVGRWASIVLQRCLSFSLGAQDYDYTMRSAVNDYLLPGRGTTWEVYEPTITADAAGAEKLEWEQTRTEYVYWKDFLTNPARTWDEVRWGAKRAYLTRGEIRALLKRIGGDDEIANRVTLDHTVEGTPKDATADDTNRKATVWCIWSKTDRKVIYVAKSYRDAPLGVTDPPLKLDNFFPFPRPLTATTATDSTIPVPDFAQYQDQADEIDELTQRISLLTKALQVRGAYDASFPQLGQLLNDSSPNTMIPVDKWAMFGEKGGFKGAVDFFPLDMVMATLQQCIEARDVCKQSLYEITGISDILRGASDPGETLGAQQIKTQWGGLRVRDRQKEVQRFARDQIRIKAEVICEVFSDDTIKTMSGVKLLTAAEKQQAQQLAQADPQRAQQIAAQQPEVLELMAEPTWDEVLALLRSDKLRGFRIDIETDSTVQPDENAERQAAVEFGTTVGGFLTQAGPIVQQAPALGKLVGEMLTFIVRRFKAGETMETAIEQAIEEMLKQQAQPKPDPEQQKAEMQAKLDEKKHNDQMTLEAKKHQDMMTLEQQRMQSDFALKQQQMQADAAAQQQRLDTDAAIKREGLDAQRAAAASQEDTKRHIAGMRTDNAVEKDTVTGKTQEIVQGAVAQMSEVLAQALENLAAAVAKQGEDTRAGMTAMAQATLAEQELLRDAAGRPIGSRRKPVMVQ